MSKVDDLIIQAVDSRFKVLANQLKFDRTYYGKVVNIDGRHAIVNINGIECRAQIKDGMFIVTNDVVVLKAPNGNFSFLYVDGKLGEAANADVKNQIGDLSTLTTTVKDNLVNSINEVDNEINVLSNIKSEYIGKAFISEEILLDATYPIAYCGSVGNSSTMPNTGQFRVQYIPYFANNEGYSVQIAWGVVTNSGLWYRVASGTRWERWESFSTTTKTDILITPQPTYKIISQKSYTINGECRINFVIAKSDDSLFPVGFHNLATVPFQLPSDYSEALCCTSINSDGAPIPSYTGVLEGWSKRIMCNVADAKTKTIVISGRCRVE